MNTLELRQVLTGNKSTRKYFNGVYSSDNLPKTIRKLPALIICNTDKSSQPGEHWIAIYISKNRTSEYFDSFGFPPNNVNFIKFLRRNSKKIKFNNKMIQNVFSDKCGYYALTFLYFKCKNKSMENFIKLFSNNQIRNDKLVLRLFKKYLY